MNVHVHCPFLHMARWPNGHGPIVDRGPQVGDLFSSSPMILCSVCYLGIPTLKPVVVF